MTVFDRSVSFAIWGPITRADLPGLCDRVCGLLGRPGVTVDALARLQLAASRRGCQVRLQNASDELCALVSFMGLQDVLPEDGPVGAVEPDRAGSTGGAATDSRARARDAGAD